MPVDDSSFGDGNRFTVAKSFQSKITFDEVMMKAFDRYHFNIAVVKRVVGDTQPEIDIVETQSNNIDWFEDMLYPYFTDDEKKQLDELQTEDKNKYKNNRRRLRIIVNVLDRKNALFDRQVIGEIE